MNNWNFSITGKVRRGVVQRAVDVASIDFSGCFSHTTTFVFKSITVNEGCYNHVFYTSVVKLIIPIYPWFISNISFQGYIKFIKKRSVMSVDFYIAPYSLTIMRLHVCRSLLNFVRMKQMILNGDHLEAVMNIQRILILTHTTVSIAVKPQMDVAW